MIDQPKRTIQKIQPDFPQDSNAQSDDVGDHAHWDKNFSQNCNIIEKTNSFPQTIQSLRVIA